MREQKGITLISLAIMIVVITIIASISFTTGKDTVELAQREVRISELKVIQAEINSIYEKYINDKEIFVRGENRIYKGTEIKNIGENVSTVSEQANKALASIGITDKSDFKYFSKEYMKNLGVEGIKNDYIVNIETRQVLSLNGFDYNGTEVYSLIQIPNEQYNVNYNP